ncbi:hypothetical protein COU17_03510 [Candidatus Kaiserbacteria bacterium CG10_big_fil_rev_8_21_14_0_10_49_17]|uniref:FAD/NAD(P)-binding domain-containing protein n=1 Tax=Candidatus Kaiserbacteria bacterium CG10_big_fil_rev_8_21_14_0_10_49_17 TaxID=1974609 RepID=A0A2M6WDM8_9BACT|nr:MAG: hypothetical protein COU17_03510 [Candidatus Kaiserbacteria bacterium CG10_big_fil_rev_8_21_14_0_10_49_17]
MYDLIIIGGGPAGAAAGVYAARKQLKSLLITKEWGGQSIDSPEIQNWIGTVAVSGGDLAKQLKEHVEAYKGEVVEVRDGICASMVEKSDNGFVVKTDDGKTEQARAILICSGAHRRRLPVEGADTFEHKGLTYCASCDGPLFSGQDVAVIGGGNAGFETAAQLLAYTKSVTLLHRGEQYKADPITVKKVLAHPNMTGILNANTTEIVGEKFVKGLKYTDSKSGEEKELAVSGVFVEIGLVPNTDFVKDLLELDAIGRIKVDGKNQQAILKSHTTQEVGDARRGESAEEGVEESTKPEAQGPHNEADVVSCGVWAAGDCTDELYHQNNIAAGDAVKALEDIYTNLKTR